MKTITPSPAIDTLIGSALHSLKDERAQAQAAAEAERRENQARVQRAFGPLWPEIAPYATLVREFDSPYQKPLLRYEIQMPGLAPFRADVFARQAEVALSAQAESGVTTAVGVSGVKLAPRNDEDPFARDGTFSDPSSRLAPFFLYLRAAYEQAEKRKDLERRTEQAGLLVDSLVKWQQPVAQSSEDASRILAELRALLPEKDADHVKLHARWQELREKERRESAREAAQKRQREQEDAADRDHVTAYDAFLSRCLPVLAENRRKLAELQQRHGPQACWTLRYALVAENEFGEREIDTGDVMVLDGSPNECDQWYVLFPGVVKKVQYRHVVSVTEREPLDWTKETRYARSVAVPEAKRSLHLSPDARHDSVTEDELRADIADLGLSVLPEPPSRPAHVSWDDARRLLADLANRWPQDAGPLPLNGEDDSYRPWDDD